MDLMTATICAHARAQMERRGIDELAVRAVLSQPETTRDVRPGRVVAQGMQSGLLLRVFVDVDREPPMVVTVYRTSRIEKYRSGP
jgi:hypothetical protein